MADTTHWPRWFQASINDYLKQVADSNNLVSLIDGIEDRDETFMQAPDRLEIRVNGPYINNPSHDYYNCRVFVNILFTSNMGETKNRYKMITDTGIMVAACLGSIPILKCGPDTAGVDDGSQLGCLTIQDGDKTGVRVNHFAQIDPTDRVRQAMLTAAYYIELRECS